MFIESSTLLEFFNRIPELFTLHWIAFKVSLDIVGHTLSKFCNRTCADTIHVYESFMIELIDKGESIPEKVSNLELEFIMVFLCKTLSNLLYLILCSIDIVFDRRFTEPTIELTITLLKPEKSGESVHRLIVVFLLDVQITLPQDLHHLG